MNKNVRRLVTLILFIGLVATVLAIGFLAMTPAGEQGEAFTELYVLGEGGNASDYPLNLQVNESGSFIVGVVNQEYTAETYTVILTVDGEPTSTATADIDVGERWEHAKSVSFGDQGRYYLEIHLHQGEDPAPSEKPYRKLYFQITVR